MQSTLPIPAIIVVLAVLIATFTDVWAFKVHNLLTLPLLLTGLVYHAAIDGRAGLQLSIEGTLFALGVLLLPYMSGGMGAGDVKLLAGVGAWLGVPNILYVFLASSLAAGVYASLMMLVHGRVRETWLNFRLIWFRLDAVGRHLQDEESVKAHIERVDRRQRLVPFAAMVALGVLATLAWNGF